MNTLFLPPLLVCLVSLQPAHEELCAGCWDTSIDPTTEVVEVGDCAVASSGHVITLDGFCISDGHGWCEYLGCKPILVVTTEAFSGNGGSIQGGFGNVNIGPLKFPTGTNTTAYRGETTVPCGGTSPYFFEIRVQCVTTVNIELMVGSFGCAGCYPI